MNEKVYRALVIEDEVDHCQMIEKCFRRPGPERVEVTFAHTVAEACHVLESAEFDFVLLDHDLPDGHGCEVLELMDHKLLTTPVIGLSTSGDPRVALADFRGGAIEFIQKREAFEGDYLRRRTFEVLADYSRRMMATLLEQRRRCRGVETSDEELVAAARIDPLMGILNRQALTEMHADLHDRAGRSVRSYCLCMIDVDHFKKYNDCYGHAAGDDVLTRVATALRSDRRPEDLVGRYGGEEIVVLIDDVDAAGAAPVALRLRDAVVALEIPHERNEGGLVTVSVGAAVFEPTSGEPAAAVFERADQAMYEAKRAGRNRAVVAKPAPPVTRQASAG